eukprot:788898_1
MREWQHHNKCLSQSVKKSVQLCHNCNTYLNTQLQAATVTSIYDEPPVAMNRHKAPMDANNERNVHLLFVLIGFMIGFIVCISVYQEKLENQLNYTDHKEVMVDEPRVNDIEKDGYKEKIGALEYEIGECHVEWGSCQQIQRQKDKLDEKRVAEITKQKNKFALC